MFEAELRIFDDQTNRFVEFDVTSGGMKEAFQKAVSMAEYKGINSKCLTVDHEDGSWYLSGRCSKCWGILVKEYSLDLVDQGWMCIDCGEFARDTDGF